MAAGWRGRNVARGRCRPTRSAARRRDRHPIYLNSFAAIPFVSGLIGLGMSPATGMAFMLATSATGFPAMVAVWALVKPRAFALYLGFAITGAMIAGSAYAAALALHI